MCRSGCRGSRPLAVCVGAVLLFALIVASCSRGTSLGPEEAVEILVLDGVDRAKAVCIIESLEGAVDLEKVTGVRTDIEDEEIAVLAQATAACSRESSTGDSGVVEGAGLADQLDLLEPPDDVFDIDSRVDALVVGGLDPVVAECLRAALHAAPDPELVIEDDEFLVEVIRICRKADGDG